MDSVLAGVFWSHTPTDKLILGLRYTAVMYNNIEFKSATELKPISSGYSFKQCLDYTLESWCTGGLHQVKPSLVWCTYIFTLL